MKIYTKRGDQGQTDLFGGARVSKAHPRVLAYGAVDAANAALGYVAVLGELPEIQSLMSDLFDLGAELATVNHQTGKTDFLQKERILYLENLIDQIEPTLPLLKNFILPTGCELAGRLHLARVSVRFAEQQVIALRASGEALRTEVIQYLNRLSDLLFIWSKWANMKNETAEVLWVKS